MPDGGGSSDNLTPMDQTSALSVVQEAGQALGAKDEQIGGDGFALSEATFWKNWLEVLALVADTVTHISHTFHNQINPAHMEAQFYHHILEGKAI